MAERSNAAVLKTVDPKGPGVRIPLSPLISSKKAAIFIFIRKGELPERSNGAVSKTVVPAMTPRVRIPDSPLSASVASAKEALYF
jgi:hypothetical protein